MNDSKNTTRFFLQQDRVHTALTGSAAVVCMRAQSGILAEARLLEGTTQSALLGADSGDSVLRVKSQALPESVAYNAYGLHSPNDIPAQRPAFNGHLLVSHLYLLGNGYRGYNPVLMRFHSPDSLSPFAAGGLNCYAYCAGDPINFSDPSGHMLRARSRSRSPVIVGSRSPSPATMIAEAMGGVPDLNPVATPGQVGQQRTLTSNAAQAQPILGASPAAPTMPLPTQAVSVRGGEGANDKWVFSRKSYDDDEIKYLEDHNAKNNARLTGRSKEESREIRQIAIDAMRTRKNLAETLRESRFKLTDEQAASVGTGLKRALIKRPAR